MRDVYLITRPVQDSVIANHTAILIGDIVYELAAESKECNTPWEYLIRRISASLIANTFPEKEWIGQTNLSDEELKYQINSIGRGLRYDFMSTNCQFFCVCVEYKLFGTMNTLDCYQMMPFLKGTSYQEAFYLREVFKDRIRQACNVDYA